MLQISAIKMNCVVCWVAIYPMDSVIHPPNNRGQTNDEICRLRFEIHANSWCHGRHISSIDEDRVTINRVFNQSPINAVPDETNATDMQIS